MKKLLLLIAFCTLFGMNASAQKFNELINLKHYSKANSELEKQSVNNRRIIFIGNSITQGWADMRPQFFADNNFVGRGIGGQTSPQLLSRFRRDVVELSPYAVVINVGTNDVAENTGVYDESFTFGNIKSMADIARANGIQVILSSVLPAGGFKWNPSITDAVEKIKSLNEKIETYALEMNYLYIDYFTQLTDENGALKSHFGNDGVHPNDECYQLMESIALETIGYSQFDNNSN